jgi:uncharacterized protein (TIGR04255 family)
MAITFAKPPINEVVLGLSFLPRLDLLMPHFGQFWSEFRDQYPKVAHAPPLVSAGSILLQDSSGAWLPRVWYINADDSSLVQLQQDRLHVNWRRTDADAPYPRFPAIRDEFYRVWALFQNFLRRETGSVPQPTRMELQYTNVIPQGEGWQTPADLGDVLRDFKWQSGGRYLPNPRRFAGNFEFELEDGSSLVAKIAMGLRVADQKEVVSLELVVSAAIVEGFDMPAWVERSHEAIVRAFKDLTSEKMHHEPWQLQDGE